MKQYILSVVIYGQISFKMLKAQRVLKVDACSLNPAVRLGRCLSDRDNNERCPRGRSPSDPCLLGHQIMSACNYKPLKSVQPCCVAAWVASEDGMVRYILTKPESYP